MFDSKTKMKAFEELGSANKSQLGANGGGVVIATGSTEKGKKTFELTEAGAKIDFVKNNEERIQKQSANQVKNIIKDENYKVKGALNDFSNNRKANNKDDSIDAAAEKEDLSSTPGGAAPLPTCTAPLAAARATLGAGWSEAD